MSRAPQSGDGNNRARQWLLAFAAVVSIAALLNVNGKAAVTANTQHPDVVSVADKFADLFKSLTSASKASDTSDGKPVTGDPDLFPPDMVWIEYDSSRPEAERKIVWKATLHGSTEFTGQVVNETTKLKGLVHGYRRANTVVLTYASESPDRPGFGTLFLRSVLGRAAGDPIVYIGESVEHDCDCRHGVMDNGPIVRLPVVLSSREVPEIETKVFSKNKQVLDFIQPGDLDNPKRTDGSQVKAGR